MSRNAGRRQWAIPKPTIRSGLLAVVAFVCVLAAGSAEALPIIANNGQINLGNEIVGPANPGAPIWAAPGTPGRLNYELISAGSGYPTLGLVVPVIPPAIGPIVPPLSSAAAPVGPFGGGATTLGGVPLPGGGGVFWTNFFVADPAALDGLASVNNSNGVITMVNNGPAYNAWGGAMMAVGGTVNPLAPGAWVSASIAGAITIQPVAGAPTVYTPSVVTAFDGVGGLPDFITPAFMNGPAPAGALTFSNFTPMGNAFTAWGVSMFPVAVPAGCTITIDGTLSLAADPIMFDASIWELELPPLFPEPDFGPGAFTPEPGSIVLSAVGLSGLLGLRRRRTA